MRICPKSDLKLALHSFLTDRGAHVQVAQLWRGAVGGNDELVLFDETVELLGLGLSGSELLLNFANQPEGSVQVGGGAGVQLGAEGRLLDEVS